MQQAGGGVALRMNIPLSQHGTHQIFTEKTFLAILKIMYVQTQLPTARQNGHDLMTLQEIVLNILPTKSFADFFTKKKQEIWKMQEKKMKSAKLRAEF